MLSAPLSMMQQTLKTTVNIIGVGLHSGKNVRMTLRPAGINKGIVFVRTDVAQCTEIPAQAAYVVDTRLNTMLGKDGVRVGTVEHLLSALYALEIDNARIEIDGAEVPVLDGSAVEYTKLVIQAGIARQHASRKVAVVKKAITIQDGDKEVKLLPASRFQISCAIDFNHSLITDQRYSLEITPQTFVKEIARARTFGFARDVEKMRAAGLGLGGSLENAIVIDDFHILNPEGLRFTDEFVRHKILDAVGDLSLIGMPLVGHLVATKTGHALNAQLVKRILSDSSAIEIVTTTIPSQRPVSLHPHPLLPELEACLA